MGEHDAFRQSARDFAERHQKMRNPSRSTPESDERPQRQQPPTQAGEQWRPIPAELVDRIRSQGRAQSQQAGEQEVQIDPAAFVQAISMLSGGKIPLPVEGHMGYEPGRQISAPPERAALTAGGSTAPIPGHLIPRSPGAAGTGEYADAPQSPVDRMRGVMSRHKRITAAGIAVMGLAGLVVGPKVFADATPVDVLNMTKQELGLTETSSLTLTALDCTPLETFDVDGMADVAWKYNTATKADIEKAKKDAKFKLPTTSAFLPPMNMPAELFAKDPAAQTKVARYPKIAITNQVALKGCDPSKEAFDARGKNQVTVDLAKIELTPTMPQPGAKGTPGNARETYETMTVTFNEAGAKDTTIAPGELDRLHKVMGVTAGSALNTQLINAFKAEVLDEANEGQCKLDIRTVAKAAIKKLLEDQAKEQGVNVLEIKWENDFQVPGEVFRKSKNPVQYTSKDAEIRNPEVSCANVAAIKGEVK